MKRVLFFSLMSLASWLVLLSCDSDTTAPDTTPPAAPTGFVVNFNGTTDGTISLQWAANTESDLAGYKLFRDNGVGTEYAERGTTTQNSYVETGLEYDVPYSYKIQAYDNSNNFSDFTTLSEPVAPINQNPPAQVANVTIYAHNITAQSQLDIEISWSPNSESDFSNYKLYRANTGVFQADEAHLLDSLTTTSFTDTDVLVDTRYYYKIVAIDMGGLTANPSNVATDLPLSEPTLTAPIGGEFAPTARPTFVWQRLEGADGYQISVRESTYSGTVWETKVDQPATGNPQVTYPSSAPALSTGGTYCWQLGTYSRSDQTGVNSYSTIANGRIP